MGKDSKKTTKKRRSKSKNSMNTGSQRRSLFLKFYAEQLLDKDERAELESHYKTNKNGDILGAKSDWDAIQIHDITYKAVHRLKKLIVSVNGDEWEIYAVFHDRDPIKDPDDPFQTATKKGHFHVAIWHKTTDSKGNFKRFRVSEVLKLLGLKYLPEDEWMWDNRGAEPIHDKSQAVAYELHKTDDAQDKGKEPYELDEIMTNQTQERLEYWFNGYFHRHEKKPRLSWQEWERFRDDAHQLGLQCRDFDDWAETRFTVSQCASPNFRVIRKSYEDGLIEGIAKYPEITRVSMVIRGIGNLGKSENTRLALSSLGLKTYAAAAGSGKFDGLTSRSEAMLFDDIGVSQAKNVFDNSAQRLHRRNSGDKPWLGDYAIATTNLSFQDFVARCMGIRKRKIETSNGMGSTTVTWDYEEDQLEEMKPVCQRLYFCEIDPRDGLVITKPQERGGRASQLAHDKKATYFIDAFNCHLFNYLLQKDNNKVTPFEKLYGKLDRENCHALSFKLHEKWVKHLEEEEHPAKVRAINSLAQAKIKALRSVNDADLDKFGIPYESTHRRLKHTLDAREALIKEEPDIVHFRDFLDLERLPILTSYAEISLSNSNSVKCHVSSDFFMSDEEIVELRYKEIKDLQGHTYSDERTELVAEALSQSTHHDTVAYYYRQLMKHKSLSDISDTVIHDMSVLKENSNSQLAVVG